MYIYIYIYDVPMRYTYEESADSTPFTAVYLYTRLSIGRNWLLERSSTCKY